MLGVRQCSLLFAILIFYPRRRRLVKAPKRTPGTLLQTHNRALWLWVEQRKISQMDSVLQPTEAIRTGTVIRGTG
jgi:hypothetical protein